MVLLDAMSLSWFCGALEVRGRLLVLWNWWGGFFWDMVLYVVVLSLAVLGFRYYICALLMLGVKMVATLVWLIVHTTGTVCCAFIKRAVPLRNFVLGERLAFCLKMYCELHLAHGLAFTILSVVTQ